jgi:hypothetical protein
MIGIHRPSDLPRGGYRTPCEATRSVDPKTGDRLPGIIVVNDNGILCQTPFEGTCAARNPAETCAKVSQ